MYCITHIQNSLQSLNLDPIFYGIRWFKYRTDWSKTERKMESLTVLYFLCVFWSMVIIVGIEEILCSIRHKGVAPVYHTDRTSYRETAPFFAPLSLFRPFCVTFWAPPSQNFSCVRPELHTTHAIPLTKIVVGHLGGHERTLPFMTFFSWKVFY